MLMAIFGDGPRFPDNDDVFTGGIDAEQLILAGGEEGSASFKKKSGLLTFLWVGDRDNRAAISV